MEKLKELLNQIMTLDTELDFGSMNVQELATMQKEVAEVKDTIKSLTTNVVKMHDAIRKHYLPGKMEDEGIDRITVSGVGSVSIVADAYISVRGERKEDAYTWLNDNGYGDLIKETVNASTLKALGKELLEKGTSLPEEYFSVSPFVRTNLRKG
jgi:hypothetical protein